MRWTSPCGLFFFKPKTADEMRISDWSSDVCSSDLETLAAATVLLPTRRACRSLQAAFLRASGGVPLLLPRLLPLGDLDPEELLFEAPSFAGAGEAELPPAVSAVPRQPLLASRILERPSVVQGKRVSARVHLGGRRLRK